MAFSSRGTSTGRSGCLLADDGLRANSSGRVLPLRRVAHVTTAHRSSDNRIFRKECVALAAAGFDVILIAVAERSLTVEGVRLVALPRRASRLSRMLLGPIDVLRALLREQPGLVHAHDPELIPVLTVWGLVTRRPTIYDAHEDLSKQVMGKPYIPVRLRPLVARAASLLERLADLRMDAIVCATPAIARNFSSHKVFLVQNFPWLRDFAVAHPIEESTPTAVSYVGGVARERGGMEMLTAIDEAGTDRSPSPELVVAGPLTAEMQQSVSTASDRVSYLGVLPASELQTVIESSRAGLVLFHPLPNHLECQPTKLFEYMAAARPFIASDFSFWRELLAEHDCGLFIDPLDVGAVVEAVNTLLSDPALAREMGDRGRAAMARHFTFEGQEPSLTAAVRHAFDSR